MSNAENEAARRVVKAERHYRMLLYAIVFMCFAAFIFLAVRLKIENDQLRNDIHNDISEVLHEIRQQSAQTRMYTCALVTPLQQPELDKECPKEDVGSVAPPKSSVVPNQTQQTSSGTSKQPSSNSNPAPNASKPNTPNPQPQPNIPPPAPPPPKEERSLLQWLIDPLKSLLYPIL